MEKLKVLDLFAGAGGLSCGFEQTNCFEIKAAVENNEEAKETYKLNHKNTKLYHDIKEIDFRKEFELEEIDVIIGGPPCQGFSNANRNRNDLISGNNQLVKEFVRAVEEIRPKAFIMENVHSMESETHKFFYSRTDEVELQALNITPNQESIIIGNLYLDTSELINFISSQSCESLPKYILNKEVLAKLKSILNKYKKIGLKVFDQSNTNKFLHKLLNNYDNLHQSWGNSYHQNWQNLKHHLLICLNKSGEPNLEEILETIIDTHNVLLKSLEIKKYNIEAQYKIDTIKQNLVVEVKTYNVFTYLKAKLNNLGYTIKPEVLNAAEYGAAQVRRRLFIIGVKGKDKALKFPPKKIYTNEQDYYRIGDAIEDLAGLDPEVVISDSPKKALKSGLNQDKQYWCYLNDNTCEIYNHIATNSTETALKRFKALKPGQNFHDLDDSYKDTYSDVSRTQNTIYKRLSYDETSRTVLNVRKSMWIHPIKDRAISIREAARLQSFKDSYVFLGMKNSQYQQVGNAVPPILARAVAESLLDTLGIEISVRLKDILKKPKITEPESLFD